MSALMYEINEGRVPDAIMSALVTWDRQGLKGVVLYLETEDGRGPLVGFILFTVSRTDIAELQLSWVSDDIVFEKGFEFLFRSLVGRLPSWMKAIQCSVVETNKTMISTFRCVGMKAVKVEKGAFGDRDGVRFTFPLLKNFNPED